jgi:hypothetical protein
LFLEVWRILWNPDVFTIKHLWTRRIFIFLRRRLASRFCHCLSRRPSTRIRMTRIVTMIARIRITRTPAHSFGHTVSMTGNQRFLFFFKEPVLLSVTVTYFTNKFYIRDHSSIVDYRYFDSKWILSCTFTCPLLRRVVADKCFELVSTRKDGYR